MLSGPNSVIADRIQTAVLKAKPQLPISGLGVTHCLQFSPCLPGNILLCSPRAEAEGLLDLSEHPWVWMALSTWDTGDRGVVGITTADGSHCHCLNPAQIFSLLQAGDRETSPAAE